MSKLTFLVLIASMLVLPSIGYAVVVPSVYDNSIYAYWPLNGDPNTDPNVGTAFDDWDNIPVAYSDPEDNPTFADFKTVKLANDENYLYVYVEYYGNESLGTYVSVDADQDLGTGFDIRGFGIVGSEAGWQNDFPFSQLNGGWNEGPLYGGPYGNGGAPIWPFWNLDGPEREWMIPLDVTHDSAGATPVFTQDTFDILIWTEEGAGDILGSGPDAFEKLTYTLATAPVLAGDYNGDGSVDAADYTVYRDSFGDVGAELPADGDNSGEVDDLDYIVWANNYGAGGSTTTAVPEPTALVSLLTIAAFASVRRRLV